MMEAFIVIAVVAASVTWLRVMMRIANVNGSTCRALVLMSYPRVCGSVIIVNSEGMQDGLGEEGREEQVVLGLRRAIHLLDS